MGKWFEDNVEWKIGNDNSIRFWIDRWLGHEPLYETYPRLYANSTKIQATIGEMNETIVFYKFWKVKALPFCLESDFEQSCNKGKFGE